MANTQQIIAKYSGMAAGVYREFIDSTQLPDVPAGPQTLVVGQFRQGPIMNPVFIKNKDELRAIFGRRDTLLEKRGCYGTLMAEQLLSAGEAIWVLNLKNMDFMSTDVPVLQINASKLATPATADYSDVFDLTGFHAPNKFLTIPETDAFIANASRDKLVTLVFKGNYGEQGKVGEILDRFEDFSTIELDTEVDLTDYFITVALFKVRHLADELPTDTDGLIDLLNTKQVSHIATVSGTPFDMIDFEGKQVSLQSQLEPLRRQNIHANVYTSVADNYLTIPPMAISVDKILDGTQADTDITGSIALLGGITDLDSFYVDGTSARQNDILDKLLQDSIKQSLFDPKVFPIRYMVDTFKTYIETNTKAQFAELAGYCKRFPVFTSTPFYHELANVDTFKDLLGQFDFDKVPQEFSFPNAVETGSWLIPCMPADYNNGFSRTVIPSVAAVAALYLSKHSGVRKVYDIVAGRDFPISVTGIMGPERVYNIIDRGKLENLGWNIIMNMDNVIQLRSSRTAYQAVSSAFNAPETIEKFLFLTDAVEPVIESRQFRYNDVNSRNEVKTTADNICDQMLADGAISNYTNVCDTSNNGAEIRARGILVLDTVLYNEYGIRIGLHRTEFALPTE